MERETILIVDDDQIMVELLAIWLEESGYATVTASDEASAVAAFGSADRVVALVCDYELRGGTGCHVVDAIHSISPGLKVIVISGHAEQRVRSGCGSREVSFLQKPFDPSELLAMVAQP